MKKNLRKLIAVSAAMVGCWGSSAWAQDLANGSYYIKNVKTGQFLVAGNSWGTQASLGKHGLDFILTKLPEGVYTLDSQISNGGDKHFLGDNGFVDAVAANMTITGDGNGIYTIMLNDTKYLSSNAGNTVVAFEETTADNEYAQWQFFSRDDMFALLDEATPENPVDATFFVKGQNFGRNDAVRNNAWVGSPAIGGLNDNMCAERYNMAFDVYQNVTGVPAGKYKLYCQGFFRYGFPDAALAAHIGATEVLETKLYANDSEASLMSIFNEDALKAIRDNGITDGKWSTGTIDGVEYKYPNDMASASAAFSAGLYQTSLDVVVGETGAIKMGFKKETANVPDGNWTIFDNFEIYYLGLDDDAIAAAKIAIENLKAEATLLCESPMEKEVCESLKYQASISNLSDTPKPSEIAKISTDLNAAIDLAKASIAIYKQLGDALEFAKNYDLTLAEDAAKRLALNETVAEIEAAYIACEYSRAEIDENVATVNAALREAVKAQTAANSNMTLAIINNSFETGNTDGWTVINSNDTGVRSNSDGTYATEGCDGNYLFNTWSKGTPVTQTVTGLPNGTYRLDALVSTDNGGIVYLTANGAHNEGTVTTGKETFLEASFEFEVTDGTATIGAIGGNADGYIEDGGNWYKADNFRLTLLESAAPETVYDLTATAAPVDGSEVESLSVVLTFPIDYVELDENKQYEVSCVNKETGEEFFVGVEYPEGKVFNVWILNAVDMNTFEILSTPGVYELTVPAGVFGDKDWAAGNGGHANPEWIFTYTVISGAGDGIASVVAEGENADVYTLNGVQVLKNADRAALKTLKKGIYVINGKKVILK